MHAMPSYHSTDVTKQKIPSTIKATHRLFRPPPALVFQEMGVPGCRPAAAGAVSRHRHQVTQQRGCTASAGCRQCFLPSLGLIWLQMLMAAPQVS